MHRTDGFSRGCDDGVQPPFHLGGSKRAKRAREPAAGRLRGGDEGGSPERSARKNSAAIGERFSSHQPREGERVTDTGNGDIAACIWRQVEHGLDEERLGDLVRILTSSPP